MNAHARTARYLNARLVKERVQAVACGIVGIGMIVGGVFALTDDDVTCGAQTMEKGEVCEETRRGETTAERDFDAQASENTSTGWLLTGGGAAMAVGSGAWAYFGFVRKKRVTAQQVAAGLTPATVRGAAQPPSPGGRQPAQPYPPAPYRPAPHQPRPPWQQHPPR